MGLKERMLEAIRAKNPDKAATIDLATVTDDALETAYREAVATPPASQGSGAGFVTLDDLRMVEARANARVTIASSTLPQPAKDKLLADFAARERFAEADVTGAITAERTYLARFAESESMASNSGNGAAVTALAASPIQRHSPVLLPG